MAWPASTPAGEYPLAHAYSAAGAAYDPDTCISGYVWREAYDGDHVCVTSNTCARPAVADNAAADSRFARNFLPYGPDTCIVGYVWRSANKRESLGGPPVRQQVAAGILSRRTPTATPVRTPVWSATSGALPMTAMMSALLRTCAQLRRRKKKQMITLFVRYNLFPV